MDNRMFNNVTGNTDDKSDLRHKTRQGCGLGCGCLLAVFIFLFLVGACGSSKDKVKTTPTKAVKVEQKAVEEKKVSKPTEIQQQQQEERHKPQAQKTEAVNPTTTVPTKQVVQQGTYVANIKTGKIHTAACASVAKMKNSNKAFITGIDAARSSGYSPCSRCRPF